MPNSDGGRQKILDYLKDNDLTITTLAVQYSMARQDVTNILNGKLKNPQANRFIARVIEDFKIRQGRVRMADKLIINWQKKNHQLSQVMLDSLVGLDIWEVLLVLGKLRAGKIWRQKKNQPQASLWKE